MIPARGPQTKFSYPYLRCHGEEHTCQQVPRAKHLWTMSVFRHGKELTCQQVLRAKHLLTNAPTKTATKHVRFQQILTENV